MPGGRPTVYDPDYCVKLIEHMSRGLSFESFAGTIKSNKVALYRWVKEHPDFAEARQTAIEACRLFWEALGIAGAKGKIKNFNATSWIFNMKNRFRNEWMDIQKIDLPKPFLIRKSPDEVLLLGAKLEEAGDEDA